jgi:hypothetical protein
MKGHDRWHRVMAVMSALGSLGCPPRDGLVPAAENAVDVVRPCGPATW